MERADIGSAAKIVWAYLADKQGDNGHAWPGQRGIAKAIGSGVNVVIRAVAELEASGLLTVIRIPGNPAGHTNRYRIGGASKSEALPNREPERCRIGGASAAESETEPDSTRPNNQTKGIKPTTPVVAVPPELALPAFYAAWSEWQAYRRESGHRLTPRTVAAQLKALAAVGPERAVEAIQASIQNGWRGLFPDKAARKKTDPTKIVAPPGKYDRFEAKRT